MNRSLLAAIPAVVATGCTATVGTVTPRSLAAEQRGLQMLRAQVRGPSSMSPVVADGNTDEVAIATMRQRSAPAVPEVAVYDWRHTTWTLLTRLALDVGGSVAADETGTTTPITTADLTQAAAPELVVTVHYNAGPASAVLSKVGGRWHPLTFHGGVSPDGDERFGLTVAHGTVTSQENDCVPDCADGRDVTTAYRFVAATGRLEAAAASPRRS